MSEMLEEEMIPIRRTLMCCGVKMKRESGALMSNPPQYRYHCPECGETELVRSSDVGIIFVPKGIDPYRDKF